jgi:SOS-response transcriptional repressor LexA
MNDTLTETQRRIIDIYEERFRTGNPPPTMRELCLLAPISSTSVAAYNISRLEKMGYLRQSEGQARARRHVLNHPPLDAVVSAAGLPGKLRRMQKVIKAMAARINLLETERAELVKENAMLTTELAALNDGLKKIIQSLSLD